MPSDREREAYLKGYEEGLREVWTDISRQITRGLSSWELAVYVNSKPGVIHQHIEAARRRMDPLLDAAVEKSPTGPTGRITRPGGYLVPEERSVAVFEIYRKLCTLGARGMVVTRTRPDLIQEQFKVEGKCLWLTTSEGKKGAFERISPSDFPGLTSSIAHFLEGGGNAALVLEGLEYLVSQSRFESVLKFVQNLNDKVAASESYLLISVNPSALKEMDYKQLQKEAVAEIGLEATA